MDLDSLIKLVQEWTNRVPLIILGSGASVPFGLPTMWTLGEYLKNNISFTDKEDQLQFGEFKTTLQKVKDLESTLLQIQLRPNVLNAIINETWKLVNKQDFEVYNRLLDNATDYPLSELTRYLLATAKRKLSIVTTNYDRMAEYAASLSNAYICTGFAQNYFGHFSKNIHQYDLTKLSGYRGQVNIWKVHGSLDWFKTKGDTDIHLPLQQNIPDDFKPLIVTPGLSKFLETQLEPFRTIFTEADNEIEKANSYLCIGYGFNDIHVQPKLINQIKNGKPIIVITKELTPKTKQAIIDAKCKQYVLIEQANASDSRVYSSSFEGEEILKDLSYWSLSEFLKIIK
jgi:hypothetical protein